MKKRIIALVLALTMVLSLVSCGDKEAPSLVSTIEKTAEITTGVSEFEMNLNFNGLLANDPSASMLDKISLKMTSVVESLEPMKASISIAYKYGEQADFKELTTLIVDNEDTYINLAQLKTAASEIGTAMGQPSISIIVAMLPAQEYIKLNAKEVQKYTEQLGVKVDTEAAESVDPSAQKVIVVATKHIAKIIEEATKEVKPALISGKGDKVTLTINKENFKASIEAVLKVDLGAAFDAFIAEAEKVEGATSLVNEIKAKKDNVVSTVKDTLTQVKDSADSFTTFDVTYAAEVTGKKGSQVSNTEFKLAVADNNAKINADMKANANEKIPDDKKVVVPTNVITLEELMNQILQLMGQ